MRRGRFLGVCAMVAMACGDDGVATTNDESSTGMPETTDPDGDDDDDDDDDDDSGPDTSVTVTIGDSSSSSDGGTVTATESSGGSSSSDASSSGSDGSSSDTSSTSGAESSTTISDDESGDASVGFILDADMGGGAQVCDPYVQDCPDGEKCNAWADDGGSSWNALGCFPLDDMPDGVGEACTVEGSGVSGIDSCDIGAMCWDVDTETNIGTCIALCIGSADDPSCADAASICIIANEGALNICLPFCDPLLQDCGAGQGCYPISTGFACAPDASGEEGLYGDGCDFINVCDPGLWCAPPEAVSGCFGAGCCSEFCDVTDPLATTNCPDSAAGQECIPFFAEGMAPPGFEVVGVCSFPP